MAPSKRQRSLLDDGETETIEVNSAHSSLRQETRKKVRLSDNPPSDGESDESTDEELGDLQATQFVENQRRKERKQNQPADNGIIESVTCTNFMCHAFLEVALGPLINFIIGHNGSGKSAVLTALMLCLGGKAAATNRAGNLKGFIKNGEESCTLSVKIKNAGIGYQQEVYGDSIIVERHFSKAGTSGFKIKNSNGRVISTRKLDLEDICDYFALSLDNPMSVLTQDMARQFLNNSNPQDKYKFFVKGTQLEQLNQDYFLLEESIDNMEETFGDKNKDLKGLEEKMRRAKEAQAMSEKHDVIRQKVRKLGRQMAWAQVEEQERFLESYNNDLRKANESVEAAKRKAEVTTATFSQFDEVYERATEAVQAVKNETIPIGEEKDQVKQEFDNLKAEAIDLQAEQRRIREHLHASELRTQKAKADIDDEYRRLEEANGGSHSRRLAEIDKRKDEVVAVRTRLEEHDGGMRILVEKQTHAQQALERQAPIMRAKRGAVDECEEQLQTLIRDRGKQQRGYPANMSQLINAIRHDNGFQQKPIGPIGDSVHLLQPSWSSILEKSFGQMLDSFIVTNKQDQSRLSGIMKRVRCSQPILIGNNHLFEFSHNESSSDFLTSLRALKINNDLVIRQMIINQGIEQTVLIEDMTEARNIMDQTRLSNVRACYSKNDKARPGAGVRLTYGWDNALSSTFVDAYKGPPRMKTDIEYQIRSQEETLQHLKSAFDTLDREHRALQNTVKGCEQAIVRHQRAVRELKIALQRAETIVEELQDALDQDAVEEGRLDVLKSGLKEAESDKTVEANSYEEAVIGRDKLSELMKIKVEQLQGIDARMAEAEVKVRKAESKALRLSNQRQSALQEKNSTIQLLEDAKDRKKTIEEARQENAGRVASFIEQASQFCARVPIDPGETAKSLDSKLRKFTADIERYEAKLGGNRQKIGQDVTEATMAYDTASYRFQEEEKLCQLLKLTLVQRRERWKQFQKRITARARLQFNWLLSERGFRGKLSVNHKRRLMDIDVQPDETQTSKGRKTQTLSGGEKSFSTICLLLSLWEAMGAPLRCLDEFDVFMDSVNRDVSMKMIIKAAKRSAGRQYILITPNSMNSVDSDNQVKIIRLLDPERGQTTITFPNA